MNNRPSRRGTGIPELDDQLVALLDKLGTQDNRDQIYEILATVANLARDDIDRLDLKITNAALREMRSAFNTFRPYVDWPKVTMFGSARTLPSDPLYDQARHTAHLLAEQGWMVVTGAGPGIMAAGLEGAGRVELLRDQHSASLRAVGERVHRPGPKARHHEILLHSQAHADKGVRRVRGFSGGFGTLDEGFELLTLVQTGKAEPTPIVLLDVPGGTYWQGWRDFIEDQVKARGLVSPNDDVLFKITDSAGEAASEILGFYRNYHSRRLVGDRLVMRLRSRPTEADMVLLNERFGDICARGAIEVTEPLPPEVADQDALDKARIVFPFDRMQHGRLRQLIDSVNQLASAPTDMPPARHYQEPQA